MNFAVGTPQVSWTTAKTGLEWNALLQFGHIAETPTVDVDPKKPKLKRDATEEGDDATSLGRRVIYVWLYKDGDPTPVPSPRYPGKPVNYTHIGHDFFDDISKFNRKYTTKCAITLIGAL